MNRRELIVMSGAAFAAQEALAQTQQPAGAATAATNIKTLLKYNRDKASYRVPKSETKLAKYVESLGAALSLTAAQQQAASGIFLNAVVARATIKEQIKAARKNISNAVIAHDSGGIGQEAFNIGNAKAQRIAIGAKAHSEFFQSLTAGQQQLLLQYRS